MRARDLAEPHVSVQKDADAIEGVRLIAEQRLPGLLVVDSAGRPCALLPACDVVRTLVPSYVQEDRGLANVIDEPHADHLCRALQGADGRRLPPVGQAVLAYCRSRLDSHEARGTDGPQSKPRHRRGRTA